jgi:NADH-quinone oxidoreductase subunit M
MADKYWAVLAATGIVLGAVYMLWLYQRTMFGKLDREENKSLVDLNAREIATLVPLTLLAFWIGLYPKPFFDVLDEPVERLVSQVEKTAEYPLHLVSVPRLPHTALAVIDDQADQQQDANPDHGTADRPTAGEEPLGAVMSINAGQAAP